MKPPSISTVRCAIYTRVSTEHGLDQEFNSLDAQYVRPPGATMQKYTFDGRLSQVGFPCSPTSKRISAGGIPEEPARMTRSAECARVLLRWRR